MNSIHLPPEQSEEAESLQHYRALLEKRKAEVRDMVKQLPTGKPIDLEIGCGHGHFLASLASKSADRYFVGIDVDPGRILRAIRKARFQKSANLAFYVADARLFLSCLKAQQISRVFVLFPDPFPKEKQKKHRLLQKDFFYACHRILDTGGQLFFRTDVKDYFDQVCSLVVQDSELFRSDENQKWPSAATSIFENRAETVYSRIFLKK